MPDETQEPIEEPINDESAQSSLRDESQLHHSNEEIIVDQSDAISDHNELEMQSDAAGEEIPDDVSVPESAVIATNEISEDTALDADVTVEDSESDQHELNLAIDDETLAVEVIMESDLTEESSEPIELSADDLDDDEPDNSDELTISIEAATEPISVLSEEDLALVEAAHVDEDNDDAPQADVIDEEEIVVKDYLNEDDGEPERAPDYLKPSTPEWKLVAQQLREEKEAQKRELLERRHEEDQRLIAERREKLDEREDEKRKQEAEFSEHWEQRQSEKKQAVDDMMQRIRDERERKLEERADFEDREGVRKLTYPKPEDRKPYPKPSELKRMEREQPKKETDPTTTNQPSPPPRPKSANDDFDLRISRLSKPEEPSTPKDDDEEKKD